jgi:hypothetical protein
MIFGVDSVQAFALAAAYVDQLLMQSSAFTSGRLAWEPNTPPIDAARSSFASNRGGARGEQVNRSELVRTVELMLDWPLACVLRVEVLSRQLGQSETYYWTRVWRSDSYRFEPTASAAVRGRRRWKADETVLVEDMAFSELSGVLEKTPEAALDTTVAKIRWQLFVDQRPKDTRSRTKRHSAHSKRR